MKLCASAALVLLLALTRARAAPASAECDKLEKLRVITDKTEVLGKFYTQAAYTDNPLFKNIFGLTSSLWGDLTETPTGLHVRDYTKMNGTCVQFRGDIVMEGDMAKSTMSGVTNEMKMHHFTDTALIMDLQATTTNAMGLIKSLHLDPNLTGGQNSVTAHCYYLISREPQVNEAELQLFKEHAKCAGFTEEPVFLHKNDEEHCTKKQSMFIEGSEECNKLERLETIHDKTRLVGPFHFMAAYADNNRLNDFFGTHTSVWGEVTATETGFHMLEFSKMNGTCVETRANVDMDGDMLKVMMNGMESEYKLRHLTQDSMIMELALTVSNAMALIETLQLDPNMIQSHSDMTADLYYLISSKPEPNEADLQLFKQQAKCAGFSGEPDFVYNKDHTFCTKEESVFVDFGSEKCHKLDKLEAIKDKTEFLGKFHFMAAFTNHKVFKNILEKSSSIWGEMALSDTGLHVTEFNKMNGTCLEFRSNVTFNGQKGKVTMAVVTSEFTLLNFTKNSLIMDLTATTSNPTGLMQALHLDQNLSQGQSSITAHCYYLISREPEVNEAELEKFKEHVKCAGFTGEPVFLHKDSKEYCTKEGSLHVH